MSCFLVFLLLNTSFCSDFWPCSLVASGRRARVLPGLRYRSRALLSQSGGDIFAAIVPPLRSSVRLEGFMKKKIAK